DPGQALGGTEADGDDAPELVVGVDVIGCFERLGEEDHGLVERKAVHRHLARGPGVLNGSVVDGARPAEVVGEGGHVAVAPLFEQLGYLTVAARPAGGQQLVVGVGPAKGGGDFVAAGGRLPKEGGGAGRVEGVETGV